MWVYRLGSYFLMIWTEYDFWHMWIVVKYMLLGNNIGVSLIFEATEGPVMYFWRALILTGILTGQRSQYAHGGWRCHPAYNRSLPYLEYFAVMESAPIAGNSTLVGKLPSICFRDLVLRSFTTTDWSNVVFRYQWSLIV